MNNFDMLSFDTLSTKQLISINGGRKHKWFKRACEFGEGFLDSWTII